MFSFRRVGRAYAGLPRVRGNATLQSTPAPNSDIPPPPPPEAKRPEVKQGAKENSATAAEPAKPAEESDKKAGRGRKYPSKRPLINLEHPRQWNRPVAAGALPVYDYALAYIKRDAKSRRDELEQYKTLLQKAENTPDFVPKDLEKLKEKISILEVQSAINLPSVRWKARNGLADMTLPVYRYLLEQRWREEGALDLLMERIHQMNVVPDLLPSLHPSFDLRVNFPEPPPENIALRSRTKRKYQKIEPGVFLLPEQTRKPPMLYTTVFHPEPKLYTLLMLDLDVPDPENQTFQTYLHWMQPNISLSAFSKSPIPLPTTHTRYVPPHPQKGTPYHRYVLLLVPQPSETERISVPVPTDEQRLGFNYREFAEKYSLDASKGGAAFMWREVWDETVSKIYKDVLKTEEPVYGRAPRPDRYAEVKQAKKYTL
ncbi:PEBP-like protein [Panus rudis PR-1116 ss-1]|nr:PEBP-like protein [Panus rudis PR-1116 ss-1]